MQRNAILSEAQLEPPSGRCGICGGGPTTPAILLQSDPEVWMEDCDRCFGSSASRIPRADVLAQFYEGYYDEPATAAGAEEAVTFSRSARLSRHIARRVSRGSRQKPLAILDFGGGDGSVAIGAAEVLHARGERIVDVCVVDPQGDDALPASTFSIRRAHSLESISDRSFDIVLASAVLEHIVDPLDVLRTLLHGLRPGGLFYARTPYMLPLARFARRFGRTVNLQYPHHLHDMGQRMWNHALIQLELEGGFRVIESRPSIVSSTLRSNSLRTIIAHGFKMPWYFLGPRYELVGGWEIFIGRNQDPCHVHTNSHAAIATGDSA